MHRFRLFSVFLLTIGLTFCGEATPESTGESGTNSALLGGETETEKTGKEKGKRTACRGD